MSQVDIDELNRERLQRARENMERADWTPRYEKWRHGGSYVVNIMHPGGGWGCIASARHTITGKFEVACFNLGTFKTREAAAYAERAYAIAAWEREDAK